MLVINFLSPQQHIYTAIHAHTMTIIIKITIIIIRSLLSGSEKDHGPALHDSVEWCDNAVLVTKDKRDGHRSRGKPPPN